jgi:hypothetical protein
MLMGKVTGTSWKGSTLWISFNMNQDLSEGEHAQQWSKPQLLLDRGPGHIVWYPSLQPMDTREDIDNRYTCLKLGREARMFFKDMYKVNGKDTAEYLSEYKIRFSK